MTKLEKERFDFIIKVLRLMNKKIDQVLNNGRFEDQDIDMINTKLDTLINRKF